MTRNPGPEASDDAGALRSVLRADLVAAMKARQPEIVAALRTALAAIDNAETVDATDPAGAPASEHIAGSRAGVGSTEADRRVLPIDELRAILYAQITDHTTAASRYDAYEQQDAAGRLRRQAEALTKYLTDSRTVDRT